ncbi:4-hydroxyphenylpyruvate dioxygenase family protein [Sphaerotilus sp.]|uniref:4-hydroxyphenylpyruvate dioxygenase family protein n=1 Tax=Sphaerotilus sp. TaxID=2093942 RepID=UPI0025F0BC24|nr:hypothetical protein [Sphaerotilus sp.]
MHTDTDLLDNPMGLMGFEFVEFASPTPGVLEPLFERMGFSLVARHRSKDVVLYRQGEINFIVNREPRSAAGYFAAEHGPSACGLAFRVQDSHKAYARALELGAQPIEIPTGPMELRLPAIKGIGGAPLYLIDRFEDGKSIYDIDFEFLDGVPRRPEGHGLTLTDNLIDTVDRLALAGVPLMTAPNEVYYEMLGERLPGHGQPVAELQTRGILVDGSTDGGRPRLLLQIFSRTLLGPVFFEFIQRGGDDGFGEGNFKALFESLERDQVRRGVLQVP